MTGERRYIIPALLVLLILVGAYIYIPNSREHLVPTGPNDTGGTPTVAMNVKVVRADQGEVKTIPPGFPQDIPVSPYIIESYRMEYTAHNVTQYTVGYVTKSQIADVIKKYVSYMKTAGYKVATTAAAYMSGDKNGNTLSVTAAPSEGVGETRVTVNYLVR